MLQNLNFVITSQKISKTTIYRGVNAIHVIDGGALLHLVKWLPNITYEDIIKQYKDFLIKAFVQCIVVFDRWVQ